MCTKKKNFLSLSDNAAKKHKQQPDNLWYHLKVTTITLNQEYFRMIWVQ